MISPDRKQGSSTLLQQTKKPPTNEAKKEKTNSKTVGFLHHDPTETVAELGRCKISNHHESNLSSTKNHSCDLVGFLSFPKLAI